MQTTEQDLAVPVSPASNQPEIDNHLTQEEADLIFKRAEEEIKPILRKLRRERFFQNALEVFCWLGILGSIVGMVYQIITYPHTLVVLYTRAKPASITTMLDLPTPTLAPVTLTRSATTATTGTGHQDARAASGILTFYNGKASQQTIARGTVITGKDGIQISTEQAITLPAANPPYFGQATMSATTLQTGGRGNIHAFDINGTVSGSVFVKNLSAFTGGRDTRTFRAVAPHDIQGLTSTLKTMLTQAFTTAFTLQPNEAAIPTNCHTTTTTTHQVGEEAQSVTLTASKICSAVAYNQVELTREAAAAFTKTRPAATYHLVGSIQTSVLSISPLAVIISGKWAYTFTPDYEQSLARQIEGDTPNQARKVLLRTRVISYASIPGTLPPDAMYINFLVLVG